MKHLCSGTMNSLLEGWYRYATIILFLILGTGLTASPTSVLQVDVCANPVLVCDDQINLSIPDGLVTIEVFMISEDIPSACYDDYEVNISLNNFPIGNQISCAYSGQILEYTLTHIPTSLSCGGTLLIEDKSAPLITCVDMDISCSEDSSPSNLGEPTVLDNCDDNPSLVSIDTYIDFECANINFLGMIERKWIATDNLGNSSTCTQQINIIRPTLVGLTLPQDITIDCSDGDTSPGNTGAPEIATLPSGTSCNFVIDFEDGVTPVCPGATKIIRRWTIIDWCTNQQISHTQIIDASDTTGPVLSCPDEFTFGANETTCDATVTFPIIDAIDDCGTTTFVDAAWEFGNGFGPFENIPVGEYSVTFTAMDECGNTSNCMVPVFIIDDIIPVAVCDLATTVGIGESQTSMICADDLDSGSFDNCELVNREIRLVGDENFSECISLTCAQVGSILSVELQVTDHVGLQNHCIVEVSVFDKTPPVIESCAADITIQCDDNPNILSLTGEPVAMDNCAAIISFTDTPNLNECNVGNIVRTFSVSDNSGNTATCTQTITLIDESAPVITFSSDVTLVCQSINDDIAKPTVEDNCGRFAFSFEDEIIENGDCIQRFYRTWEVLNICTDMKVSQGVNITLLNDTNLPEFSGVPVEITINCADPFPGFIAPTITDICDTDLQIEFTTIEEDDNCPSIRNVTRTYVATDDCGNSNTFTQTIRLIDSDAPTFVSFPSDQTINCDEEAVIVLPEFMDTCDEMPELIFTEQTAPGECANEEIIFRTYTVTDQCGNSTAAIQRFHFVDNVAPIIRGQTQDFTLSCEFEIPVFDLAAIDNCDEDLDIAFTDSSIAGDCPNEEVVTRINSVTDDCGNVTLDTIVVSIVDNTPPVLFADNLVENLVIACDQAMPVINFTVTDNCDPNVEIIETRDSIGDPCNFSITRTFSATDDCGNMSLAIQNLTVIDDQAPFFSTFPQDQNVTIFSGEAMQVDVIDAAVIDNCSEQNDISFILDLFSDGDQPSAPNQLIMSNNASAEYPLGEHTITFNAIDQCGNSTSRELLISVFDFVPTNACQSVSLEIGENGLLLVTPQAILDDPTIVDIDELTIRFVNPSNFTEVIGTSLLFNCDDIGINQYAIEIISEDGNSTICSNLINIIDPDGHCGDPRPNEAAIAGKIFSPSGENMSDINVNLQNEASYDTDTDQFGLYLFESLPMGSNCEVAPKHDKDPMQGITTFDMVLIQKHILQINEFTNPFQHIAADVNLNGRIDIQDLLEIRSLLLFQTSSFSQSPSYRFIKADYQFEDPQNPLDEELPSSHICQDIKDTQFDLDFISIKMGDIDGSSFQFDSKNISERTAAKYILRFEDQILPAKATTSVEIKGVSLATFSALQFGLQLSHAELVDVQIHTDINRNVHIKENDIHFAWTTFDGHLPQQLFTLKIKVVEPVLLSSILDLYVEDDAMTFDKNGLATRLRLDKSSHLELPIQNILEQNRPNPFTNLTDIPFYLEKDGVVTLQIKNLEGKTVHIHTKTYSNGWHNYNFAHDNFAPGIYIYTLTQNNTTQTKKMVITK